MTDIERGVVEFLESLVHNRFTEKELNEKLSKYFDETIEIYNASQGRIDSGEDSDELADFNWMFNSEKEDTYGYFDIYMLPTREDGVWYVTEIGYEFD